MDITPHVNLLRSLRGFRINYVTLIGEGVDNAFDAAANHIAINFTEDEIAFDDDGVGITFDRIASLFSLGDHGPMDSTRLGRFGVGIKSQAVNAGDILKVISTSRDGRLSLQVNWREILKRGEWKIENPHRLPVVVGRPTGTLIVIGELRHTPRINDERVLGELAYRFYPAVADGKTIELNGVKVPKLPEPGMVEIVDRHLALSGGRNAHLRGGLLEEPTKSKMNKVHVAYGHRVIMPASTLGCGEYSGLTRMFARLQVSGPWHLGTYKDDLTDDAEREELEQAVLEALRPVLEKCDTASMSAKINRVASILNEMIPESLTPARPQKTKEKKKPGEKKGKTGVVDADKSDQGGPAKSKRPPRDTLMITLDGRADEDGIGAFERGSKTQPHRVNLAKDDPFIAELIEHRDEGFGARCLLAIAFAIFEEARPGLLDQSEFQFIHFGMRIANLLKLQDSPQVNVSA